MTLDIKKADDELQILYAEVYAPGVPDSQNDFMSADEIRSMAYDFMRRGNMAMVDKDHDHRTFGACIVESFIARDDDPDFIPGAWVVGIHIPDPITWGMVKAGAYNGLSLDGDAERSPRELTLDIPEQLTGKTTKTDEHEHSFEIHYGPDGEFLGGVTDTVNGHRHRIVRGTVTEDAAGHSHRFSYVENITGR